MKYDPQKSSLKHVSPALRERVERFLADDSVHEFAKETIRAGLMLDPVDAFTDLADAMEVLRNVAEAIVDDVKLGG